MGVLFYCAAEPFWIWPSVCCVVRRKLKVRQICNFVSVLKISSLILLYILIRLTQTVFHGPVFSNNHQYNSTSKSDFHGYCRITLWSFYLRQSSNCRLSVLLAVVLLPVSNFAVSTQSAISHRKLLTIYYCLFSFFAWPEAMVQNISAHWLPFRLEGGGVQCGGGECRAEWQMVGEQWESHWLTGWKLDTRLWSCLTAGVSLLPLGRGPVYWPTWYP